MRQVQYNLCSTCEAKEAVPPKPYVTVAYVTTATANEWLN